MRRRLELPQERYQHDQIQDVETGRAGVRAKRVETQTMLDRYLIRRLISGDQWAAGQALYQRWYQAGGRMYPQGPYVVGAMRVDNGGGGLIESRIDAVSEISQVMKTLGRHWGIVQRVCIFDLPARNMTILRQGLDLLAGCKL